MNYISHIPVLALPLGGIGSVSIAQRPTIVGSLLLGTSLTLLILQAVLLEREKSRNRIGEWPPVEPSLLINATFINGGGALTFMAIARIALNAGAEEASHSKSFGMLFGAFYLFVVGSLVGRSKVSANQAERDRLGNLILQEESDLPFVLLLRPFVSIDGVSSSEVRDVEHFMSYSSQPMLVPSSQTRLETHLCLALEGIPVVALGEPDDVVGAANIETSDSDWVVIFRRLLERCSAALLFPLDTPGTRKEVELLILSGSLRKCVFICPPRMSDQFRHHWRQSQSSLESIGIRLPDYQSRGFVFQYEDNLALRRVIDIGRNTHEGLREAIGSLTQLPTSQDA